MGMRKPDFERVFARHQRSADAMLVVMARRNRLQGSRLGLAIAKKKTPRAVDRNRLKRVIRESFRRNQPFSIAIDVVVMNQVGVERKTNQQLFESLDKHWRKIINKLERQS